jgi:hypothetical protein
MPPVLRVSLCATVRTVFVDHRTWAHRFGGKKEQPHVTLALYGPPCGTVLPLALFQFFVHAPPVYALIRVGTNAHLFLEAPSQHGADREVRPTGHHLPHAVQASAGSACYRDPPTTRSRRATSDSTTMAAAAMSCRTDDVEAAQLVGRRDGRSKDGGRARGGGWRRAQEKCDACELHEEA